MTEIDRAIEIDKQRVPEFKAYQSRRDLSMATPVEVFCAGWTAALRVSGAPAEQTGNTDSPKLLDLLKLIEFNIRSGFYNTALERVGQAVEQLRAGA